MIKKVWKVQSKLGLRTLNSEVVNMTSGSSNLVYMCIYTDTCTYAVNTPDDAQHYMG